MLDARQALLRLFMQRVAPFLSRIKLSGFQLGRCAEPERVTNENAQIAEAPLELLETERMVRQDCADLAQLDKDETIGLVRPRDTLAPPSHGT
jgi:hypothetical protein